MFKKSISIILALFIVSYSSIIGFASSDSDYYDLVNKAVYLTDDKDSQNEAKDAEVFTVNIKKSENTKIFETSGLIIVNCVELSNSEALKNSLKKEIKKGKYCFVRTNNSHNRGEIAMDLGLSGIAGKILLDEKGLIKNAMGTFGYIAFLDKTGKPQLVRQKFVDSDYIESTKNSDSYHQIFLSEDANIDHVPSLSFETTLKDELVSISSFFPSLINRENKIENDKRLNELLPQSEFYSYDYEIIYDTEYYYKSVRDSFYSNTHYIPIGAITRAMYAQRLYIASSGWSDSSTVTSKWGYFCDVWMQPLWNQSLFYRAMNKNLSTSFWTYPLGENNATYMMKLRDYTPKTDLSGETESTISIGADYAYNQASAQAGISATTTYHDVETSVDTWVTGFSHDYNAIRWIFKIGSIFDRLSSKPIFTSVIDIPSGVLLWNYKTNYSCVQMNFDATWYINQGIINLHDLTLSVSDGIVWQPDLLW